MLRSSRRNLPDMPMAPPLGELANEVRLRGQGCCQTALHCDSIAPTKSLPIAARRLSGDRLALSVTPVACHLSQRERLWHTRRLKNPLSEIAALRGAGYLAKWENSNISSCKNALCQGGNLPISWHSAPTLPKGAECQVGKLAKYNVDILLNSHFAI